MNPQLAGLSELKDLVGINADPARIRTGEDIFKRQLSRLTAEKARLERRIGDLLPGIKEAGCEWALLAEVDQVAEVARAVKALEVGLAYLNRTPAPCHDALPG